MKITKLLALTTTLALAAGVAKAQDSALLDLLVKKKVITEQEAESTKAELAKEYSSSPAGKINISTPVKQLTIYGDARLRYDIRHGGAQVPAGTAPDSANADQFRYRLRLGANVNLTDDWFLGFRLETSNNPRSTNVTFSNGGSNVAPFGKAGTASTNFITTVTPKTALVGGQKVVTGFTTKTSAAVTKVDFADTVFVGQLYLKYSPYSWLNLEAGKMPNPFVSTVMTWDPDINPEGVAEQFKYTIGPFGSPSAPVASNGKDTKEVVTTAATEGGPTIDLFANFAQFVYDSATPQNQFGAATTRNDSWMFGYQVGARANFSKTIYFQLAPTFYNYSGERGNDFNTVYSGDPGGNQTGINDLAVFDIPMEFGWTWAKIPFRVFGDYAVNVDGDDRAAAAGHPGSGGQNTAWQVGIGINKIKKGGDWELLGCWERSEQYALDPNLIDNDIFDGHLNMQGIILRAGYAFTDAVTVNFTYNHGQIINSALGTGGSGGTLNGTSSNPALHNYNLFQADLNVKF